MRWKLKYVDRARPDADARDAAPVRLGKALHTALEAYHRRGGGASAARRALAEADVPEGAEGAAHAALSAFTAREEKRKARVVGVETPFRVDLDGVPFTGIIDRLEAVGAREDRVALVDYKTGRGGLAHWLVHKSPQLGYYQMGAERALGYRVDHLAIEHVGTGLRFTSEPRAPDVLEALVARAHAAWDAMRAGPWPATPGRDCPCEFASRCPYYQDLYPTILDWSGTVRGEVARAVEAYAATRDTTARARVESHLVEHGVLRAWGPAHVVERTPGGLLRVKARTDVGVPARFTGETAAEA